MTTFKILTVSDIHRIKVLYRELSDVVERHRPHIVAVVGDFLYAFGFSPHRFAVADCAKLLANLACDNVVFVRGNHEDGAWKDFSEAWTGTGRRLNSLHGEAFVAEPLAVVGFPCSMGDARAYEKGRSVLYRDPKQWLSTIRQRCGPAMRALWLMHEPPAGTPLTSKSGPVSGDRKWNDVIEHFCPLLTISGHDHLSPVVNNCWHVSLGQTVCVNVGQSDSGPLHYCLLEARFQRTSLCLPSSITVRAFPWRQVLTIPGDRGQHLSSESS